MSVKLKVNGEVHEIDAPDDTPLLYVLRDFLDLSGPKFGCGLGQCGACTVHMGGQATRSCITPLSVASDHEIITLEGLGSPQNPHPLQSAFIENQSLQCGYCANGMIMTSAALLAENPTAGEQEIRSALDGNLCRCGSHGRIVKAVLSSTDKSVVNKSVTGKGAS